MKRPDQVIGHHLRRYDTRLDPHLILKFAGYADTNRTRIPAPVTLDASLKYVCPFFHSRRAVTGKEAFHEIIVERIDARHGFPGVELPGVRAVADARLRLLSRACNPEGHEPLLFNLVSFYEFRQRPFIAAPHNDCQPVAFP